MVKTTLPTRVLISAVEMENDGEVCGGLDLDGRY
jgi:hypothetical protein